MPLKFSLFKNHHITNKLILNCRSLTKYVIQPTTLDLAENSSPKTRIGKTRSKIDKENDNDNDNDND